MHTSARGTHAHAFTSPCRTHFRYRTLRRLFGPVLAFRLANAAARKIGGAA